MFSMKETDGIFWIYGQDLKDVGYLLTQSETIFFQRLREYLKEMNYYICPKVRVGDVIYIEKKRWHRVWTKIWRPWTVSWKIDRTHIDFLIINTNSSMIKYAIELDDPSHATPERKYHDMIKSEAFAKVGIPLIRFEKAEASEMDFREKWIL